MDFITVTSNAKEFEHKLKSYPDQLVVSLNFGMRRTIMQNLAPLITVNWTVMNVISFIVLWIVCFKSVVGAYLVNEQDKAVHKSKFCVLKTMNLCGNVPNILFVIFVINIYVVLGYCLANTGNRETSDCKARKCYCSPVVVF